MSGPSSRDFYLAIQSTNNTLCRLTIHNSSGNQPPGLIFHTGYMGQLSIPNFPHIKY